MEKDVKQVLVLRKDLNMRKGKMVAQGSHGSMAPLLEMMRGGKSHLEYEPEIIDGYYEMKLRVKVGSALDQWLRGCFKKICVSVDSDDELMEIYRQAKEAGLPAVLIVDSGLTEFCGVPTDTCVGIGPAYSDEIDKITGHLKLL